MKKYPITYKNELYEVRWEGTCIPYITIYKVSKFLKLKFCKGIFSVNEYRIAEHINIPTDHPNYHIEQIKTIFKLWEQETEEKIKSALAKQKQQQTLKEWDGIIN